VVIRQSAIHRKGRNAIGAQSHLVDGFASNALLIRGNSDCAA
jgi:hypothetical protein